MDGFLYALTILVYIVIGVLSFLLFIKVYLQLTTGRDNSPTCLIGKTALVTGANTGIGFCTAQDFAKRGARVILACRNVKKAEDAQQKIIEATGNSNVIVVIVDFSSLNSVREAAKIIAENEEKLDILVNNAAIGTCENVKTEDDLNYLMQVNHFGPFLFTLLLIDLLKRSAPSRIVNVSSFVARYCLSFNGHDINSFPEGKFAKHLNYRNSKLCNILFTNELGRRLKGSGVDTNSLHPGVVKTSLMYDLTKTKSEKFNDFVNLFAKTAEEGAQTSIYLSVSKDIEGTSGEYFEECKLARMPAVAKNQNLAKLIWEKSEKLVGLTQEEGKI